MKVKKLKFSKDEIRLLSIVTALTGGIWYYGQKSIKKDLVNSGYAYLNPENKKLQPTESVTQVIKQEKKQDLQQAENATITTPASSLFDYNSAEYRASKDYYLSQSTGTFYDENGNKIVVENDGTISIPVWSAVKQGIRNVFSIF